jgi:hypothetical protein
MSKDYTVGFIIVALLLGGIFLLTRRPAAISSRALSTSQHGSGNIRFVANDVEPRRYQNKETRHIEYNSDGLPTLIEITRDYAVT